MTINNDASQSRHGCGIKDLSFVGDNFILLDVLLRSRVNRLALKIIDKSQLTQQEQSAVDFEVSLIRCISHPNILQLMDELDTPSELYLIMEYVKTTGSSQVRWLVL